MPVYWDCNATTPVEPAVRDAVLRFMTDEIGNAGSRTHEFGLRAKQAVEQARRAVASVVDAASDEIVFTSGATESNNLAILGLAAHGDATGRRHIVSTQIEHKAVLEPLQELASHGFEVTLVPPTAGGWVDPAAVRAALRPTTLLVSVMHVNNETGVVQPLGEIADALGSHEAFLHVDAAQGFGKDFDPLRSTRIDLISVSGHKLYAPKGVGALVARKRKQRRPPLRPLMFGGGQERGLRPGTAPVPLIAGLGVAAEVAVTDAQARASACQRYRRRVIEALAPLRPETNGDPDRTLPHVLNVSLPGLDSEAVMLALKGIAAFSNGSACTSHSYEPSHVLSAMGLPAQRIEGAVRLSWCHLTPEPDWSELQRALARLA
jgi:cysteine desulfurase